MIIKGSDLFIDSVIWIAKVTKIPDLIIGATLVSIGTTLPELMVSVSASAQQNSNIALGNALGSIICNTGLILAMVIIISRPEFKDKKSFQQKGILLTSLLLLVFLLGLKYGEISKSTSFFLFGILILYIIQNIRESLLFNAKNTQNREYQFNKTDYKTILFNIISFMIGLLLTITGSRLLVANGEKIALFMGVPDIVIGLTMTALGTSLPELMTAITALRKKAQDISLGNILGANILNIILVIAASANIFPISIDSKVINLHLPFGLMIVFATISFSFFSHKYFKRRYGFILLFAYSSYILFTFGIVG